MTKLTESHIETFAIELLQKQGYEYLYGPDIAPNGEAPLRAGFDEVLLLDKLKEAIDRINPKASVEAREDALRQVRRVHSPQLVAGNEMFHPMLTEGVQVTVREGEEERGDYVWLLDFEHQENNNFCVVNQFTVIVNTHDKRPDVVLFVNGLPLVVLELKNPADENATIDSAFKQLQTYQAVISPLFTYNSILVISDSNQSCSKQKFDGNA